MSDFQKAIDKVAKLAAIKLTDEEKVLYAEELKPIFTLLDNFKEINTDEVKPLQTVNDQPLVTREDISEDPQAQERVLASANNIKYGFFVTPKVIEE
jgi:aspartyl-tRNA(Asn)/glutamyl-tRNA(Gln) amidotransferase subunit C